VFGTQAIATLVAVYGVWVVPPLGWRMAGLVWGYALVWFLVTDPIKLLAYKALDGIQARDVAVAASPPRRVPVAAPPAIAAKAAAHP
jgi:H+-transporting ATPase